MKTAFFETTPEDQEYLKERCEGMGVSPLFFEAPFNAEALVNNLDIEAVSVFVGSRLTPSQVQGVPGLKLITTRSTGFDHLDIQGLSSKGIRLGYVPGYGDNTVAEFALGLALAVIRRIPFAFHRIRAEGEFTTEGCAGFDLMGKTMGIIGTGRIGKHMVRISSGIGMSVIAYDPRPDQAFAQSAGMRYVPLEELLAQADVVSVHVPLTPETRHLIDAKAFAAMKPGAVLVNTARGAVIDTHALLAALQKGTLGGFGADVLEGEEHVTDERAFLLYGQRTKEDVQTLAENLVLVDLPNVVLTPHIAFYTKEALRRILQTDMENIASFMKSGAPLYDIMASKRVSAPPSPQGERK